MIYKKHIRSVLMQGVCMLAIWQSPAALAQDTSTEETVSFILEEIIVTATKRKASLQDIPLSVSVVTGDFIAETNLNRMEELAPYVPNFSITEGAESTFIEIRGLGSGGNFGFEQSVGMFIDGVFYGRDRQFRAPFLDIERVEILRGPQGTLFGKNTISGAVNITTAKPGEEFEARTSIEYEPKYESLTTLGILSVPLSEKFGVRFAFKRSEIGGFLHNTLLDADDNDRKETVGRASFAWHPSDNLTIEGKFEISEFQKHGENLQVIRIGPGLLPLYQAFDANFDGVNDDTTSKSTEFTDTDAKSAVLSIEYRKNGYAFNSITGYSSYNALDDRDVDWSPIDFLREPITQDFEQFSQEFRLTSPVSETFDYIVGVYGQTNSLDYQRLSSLELGILGFPAPFDINVSSKNSLDQSADSFSAFAQGTWHLAENWNLTAGVRYSHESKTGEQAECYTNVGDFNCLDPLVNPTTFAISQAGFDIIGFFPHETRTKRTENNFSPSANLQWDVTEDVMLYASVNTGFKGGGFNAADRAGNNPEFEDESALAFEIGGKTTLLNGAAQLNFALFRTNYDDLQVSSFVSTAFIVGNAAKATVQGIELDGVWQMTEKLRMSGSFAFLDAEYDEYIGAGCSYAQENLGEPGCSANGTRDISGRDITGVNLSGSLRLDYTQPVSRNLNLRASVDINYSEAPFVEPDPDSYGSYAILNGRLELMQNNKGWSVALIGKNLTNQRFLSNIFDAPVQSGSRLGQRNAPRTIALRASYDF